MRDRPRHIGVRLEGERDEAVRHVAFEPGPTLRDLLNRSSAPARSGCAGLGACGLCRVRIDEGRAGPPSAAEVLHLGEEALAAGTRLACQITPDDDMDVTVLEPARPSSWRTLPTATHRLAHPRSSRRDRADRVLGVAVDLGTSQITVAACHLGTGELRGAVTGPNPQARHGADVVSRLEAASRSELAGDQLRRLVIDAIGSGLVELSRREGLALPAVRSVRIVGNSAMLTLLTAASPGALLDPAGWAAPLRCVLRDGSVLAEAWSLSPDVPVDVVQPLGGFVGSDLLAGVVHCRLEESAGPALLVDFGTNSEIALWDGGRLWMTAAAGGPAFEAMGIACGVRAGPGAIHRLTRSADGAWSGDVLDAGPPRGLCGSGLVDLLALLRASGEVDERGRPAREPMTVAVAGAELCLGKADVDTLQRAKGAVAAGIDVLCRRAGVPCGALGRVHVAGSFGEYLDVRNAQRIGLLPPVPPERVALAGNTALHGALDLLCSEGAAAALVRARQRAKLVNLSMEEDFEELFLEHLHLRPMAERCP